MRTKNCISSLWSQSAQRVSTAVAMVSLLVGVTMKAPPRRVGGGGEGGEGVKEGCQKKRGKKGGVGSKKEGLKREGVQTGGG